MNLIALLFRTTVNIFNEEKGCPKRLLDTPVNNLFLLSIKLLNITNFFF